MMCQISIFPSLSLVQQIIYSVNFSHSDCIFFYPLMTSCKWNIIMAYVSSPIAPAVNYMSIIDKDSPSYSCHIYSTANSNKENVWLLSSY